MRKVFKALKFIGAYLLITIATAVGVVFLVPTKDTSANIGAGNISTMAPVEQGNFTTVVNNLMALSDFNVDVNATVKDNKGLDVGLDLNLDIHATTGFATIDAQGSIQVTYNGQVYNLNITFTNNTLYIEINPAKITITTNSLMDGITQTLKLLDIELNLSMGEFDVSMISALLQGYTETETDTGYDLTLTVMGFDINMICDKEFNVHTIKAPLNVSGMDINVSASINRPQTPFNIAPPTNSNEYLNLGKITNLLDFANTIKQNKYLHAGLQVNYKGLNLAADIQADFNDTIQFLLQCDNLGDPLALFFNGNSLYTKFGNLKVQTNLDDFATVADYIKNTIYPKLQSMNIEALEKTTQTIQTSLNKVKNTELDISVDNILELVSNISLDGNNLHFSMPNVIDLTLITDGKQVNQIKIVSGDLEIILDIISVTKQAIVFDTEDYVQFENLFTNIQAIVASITQTGANASLQVTVGQETYNLHLYVQNVNNQLTFKLTTTIYNKLIELIIKDQTLYVQLDNLKIKVPFEDIGHLANYLASTFNFTLPQASAIADTVKALTLKDISLDFISSITATKHGMSVEGNNYSIKLTQNNGFISDAQVKVGPVGINLVVYRYGTVDIGTVRDSDYTHYSEIFTAIDNAMNFINNRVYNFNLTTQIAFAGQTHTANIFLTLDTQTLHLDGIIDLNIDGQRHQVLLTYINNTVYLSYKQLKLKATESLLARIPSLLNGLLPNASLDATLPSLSNTALGLNEILNLVEKYTNALQSISFENNSLQVLFDLSYIDSKFSNILYLVAGAHSTHLELNINNLHYGDLGVNLSLVATASQNTINQPVGDYIDLERYVNLISNTYNKYVANKYIDLDLQVNYKDINVAADFTLDLNNTLKMLFQTQTFGDQLSVFVKGNTLFTQFGNIKLQANTSDFKNIVDFVKNTLYPQLQSMNIEALDKASQSINTAFTQAKDTQINPTLADIVGLLENLTFDGDSIFFSMPNVADIDIIAQNEQLQQIVLSFGDLQVIINVVSLEKQNIVFDTNGFVKFEDIFPTIKAAFSSLTQAGVSANLQLTVDGQTYDFNLYVRNVSNQTIVKLTTTIFNKQVVATIQGKTAYIQVDNLKVKVPFKDFDHLINYLASTFNFTLPQATAISDTVKAFTLKDISLDFISSIAAVDNGFVVSGKDYSIKLLSDDNFITNLTVNVNNIVASLTFAEYGAANVEVIKDKDYTHYSQVITAIENVIDFVHNTTYSLALQTTINYKGNSYLAAINLVINTQTGDVNGKVDVTINNQTYTINVTYINKTVYLTYEELNLKADNDLISTISDIVTKVLPSYIDMAGFDKALSKVNDNSSATLNTNQIIDFVQSNSDALNSISFADNKLTILLNLAKLDKGFTKLLSIVASPTSSDITITIDDLYYDNVDVDITAVASVSSQTITAPTQQYIDIDNYLNLVTTLHNTIQDKFLDLDANVVIDNYSIDADIIVDFTKDLKVLLASNSLGSNLDIRYMANKGNLLVDFGNLQLDCNFEQFVDLYKYITQTVLPEANNLNITELKPILEQLNGYLDQAKQLTDTTNTKQVTITLSDVVKVLNDITFSSNSIVYNKNGLSITIDTTNNRFNSVVVNVNGVVITLTFNQTSYTNHFNVDINTYASFKKVYTKLTALVDSLITRQLSGVATISLDNGNYEYVVDYALSYANNSVFFNFDTTAFNQDIKITYQDGCLYVTIDELSIKAGWNERHNLVEYINKEFGQNFKFPSLKLADLMKGNKQFSLKSVDIDVLSQLTVTDNGMTIVVGGITINLINQGTKITNINVSSSDFELDFAINAVGTEANIQKVKDTDYVHYTVVTSYIDEVSNLMDASKDELTDQYSITGSLYVYETNFKGTPYYTYYADGSKQYSNYMLANLDKLNLDIDNGLLNQLAIELRTTGKGQFYIDQLNGLDSEFDVYFNSDNTNGGLYFNYNKLKLFLSKYSLNEILTSAKRIIPMLLGNDLSAVLDMVKFTENNDIYVEIGSDVTNAMPKGTDIIGLIEQFAPLLTKLSLDKDGVLEIGLDLTSMSDMFKEPLVLKIYTDDAGRFHLAVDQLFIGGNTTDGYKGISFDLSVDTIAPFVGKPSDMSGYMDLSQAGGLLNALANTMEYKEFSITSTIDVSIASILDWQIPLNLKLNFTTGEPIIVADLGPIPAVVGLNNDVPYVTGDTDSGTDRTLHIYYKGGYVYFYRHENVKGWYVASDLSSYFSRSYEKALKVTLNEFMADPLGLLLQYGCGFGDTIMSAINDAIAQSETNKKLYPMDYSNILKGFTYTANSKTYDLVLNLKEIAKNDDLDTMKAGLTTTTKNGKEYLHKISFYMNMPIGITIELQTLDTHPLTIDLGAPADVSAENSYMNNYKFPVGEEWHADRGNWKQDSGDYQVIFNTQLDGYTIDTVTAHVGDYITLPTINQTKVVTNGNDRDTYAFAGWTTSSSGNGKVLTGSYKVPRGGANLYAKWVLVESIRTTNFYVDGVLVSSQTANVGTALNSVNVDNKVIYSQDGKFKYVQKLAGWVDKDGVIVTAIEQETQNVYAYFETVETYELRTVNFVNSTGINPVSYSNYAYHEFKLPEYKTGDTEVVGNKQVSYKVETIGDTTNTYMLINEDGLTITYLFDNWYTDAAYTNVYNGSDIMPDADVTLYGKWNEVSRAMERNISIYDNGVKVYNDNLMSGSALDINTIASQNSKVVYNENTKWYLDADYTNETAFPTVMTSESDIVLHICNKYKVDITYYVKEAVSGLDAHVEKHYVDYLYQGETITFPTQTNYEITYYTNATKAVPTHITAYVFGGYVYNGQAAPTVMDNKDMTITPTITQTTENFYAITFHTDFVRSGWWWSNGEGSLGGNYTVGTRYVLKGATIQGTTLTKRTSILNNTTATETISADINKDYGGVKYYYTAAAWNTSGCKNLDTSMLGKDASPSTATITINSNTDVYVEWKSA